MSTLFNDDVVKISMYKGIARGSTHVPSGFHRS